MLNIFSDGVLDENKAEKTEKKWHFHIVEKIRFLN